MPEIEGEFGGELRRFNLKWGGLRKVQERCDAGPSVIASRLLRCAQVQAALPGGTVMQWINTGLGDWRLDDVREPIFQGLLGAGMLLPAVSALVREWIEERGFEGLVENAGLALSIVTAGPAMPKDEDLGGKPGGDANDPGEPAGASSAAPTASSAPPTSTGPAAPSA